MDTQPSIPWVQVLQSQFNEQLLSGETSLGLLADAAVIRGRIADCSIEYRRIGRKARHRQLIDIAAQGAVVENFAGDVVEPQTLSQIVQGFRDCHDCS
jgi:hypothetical protein